jgi:hypothetical protein
MYKVRNISKILPRFEGLAKKEKPKKGSKYMAQKTFKIWESYKNKRFTPI